MTLTKFLLSGFSTITILVVGWPILMLYPVLKTEKATGLAAVAGGFTKAVLTPQFWISAILLLLFFWYMNRIANKILQLMLFWVPTVLATLIGGVIFAVVCYIHLLRPR